MTKKNIDSVQYKDMAEYTYEECGFAIFLYEDTWSWVVVPKDIIETERYEFKELKCRLIDVLPYNTYSMKGVKDTQPEKIIEDLLEKEICYSDKLTAFMNDTGYKVFWLN